MRIKYAYIQALNFIQQIAFMNKRGRYIVLFVLILLFNKQLQAQSHALYISENPLQIKYPARIDSIGLNDYLFRFVNRYMASGYASCSVDSVIWRKEIVKVYFYAGNRYKIGQVEVLNDSGFNHFNYFQNRFKGNTFDTFTSFKMAEEALNYLENTGFPFARVQINNDPVRSFMNMSVVINCGPYFVFDTMHIDGERVLKSRFMEAYTGIRSGQPYNESALRKANEKLNQLPFLISERPPQIVFIAGGKAKPYYYIKKKKSDQVNGIVGLAPSTTSGSSGTNLVLTGEFVLRLNNLFKSAKMLNINWRSFRARSQELKTAFNYPYVLGKPIGIDMALDFIKFDTLYSTLQRQLGLQYYTSGINGFKLFYQITQTNLITVDTNTIRTSKQLPAINAIEIKQYGLSGTFNLLDYRFNPLKGWLIDFTFTAGSKTILRDNVISELRFGSPSYSLYDSVQLKNNQFQYHLRIDKFIPISGKSTFRLGTYLSQISASRIFFNELMREGGINSLKGFNEQSIFASNFNMLEIEYRYLFSANSHFKLFWNGAYYEDKSVGNSQYIYDWPWGFGAGANIETGSYILSLMYALGKEKGNSFDLRTGKVHFGISNYF